MTSWSGGHHDRCPSLGGQARRFGRGHLRLQDQVTASVVGAIAPKLKEAEIERSKRKPTDSLDAYDYYLRGLAAVNQWTREASDEALSHYRAIEIDPMFAADYGWAARCPPDNKDAFDSRECMLRYGAGKADQRGHLTCKQRKTQPLRTSIDTPFRDRASTSEE